MFSYLLLSKHYQKINFMEKNFLLLVYFRFRITYNQGIKEKIFQRVRRWIPGPQILLPLPPKPYRAHAVKSFFVRWVQIFIEK